MIFKFVDRLLARRRIRKQAKKFKKLFGIFPEQLNQNGNEREVWIRLIAVADFLYHRHDQYMQNTCNWLKEAHYKETFDEYQKLVELVKYFSFELAEAIPHWSEVHAFAEPIVYGKKPGVLQNCMV